MITPSPRTPEPSFGPDEEGDVVPPADPSSLDDPAAWVHLDRPEKKSNATENGSVHPA